MESESWNQHVQQNNERLISIKNVRYFVALLFQFSGCFTRAFSRDCLSDGSIANVAAFGFRFFYFLIPQDFFQKIPVNLVQLLEYEKSFSAAK